MNPQNNFISNNHFFNQSNNQNDNVQMLNQFMSFMQGFKGNPEQEVMNMLANGQMTQSQFEELSKQAKQIGNMFQMFKKYMN